MNIKNDGNDNIVAGRDVYYNRAQGTLEKLNQLPSIFAEIDGSFSAILGNSNISRWGKAEIFSSEKLFGSLVTIGIPVSIAISVPSRILPLLQISKDNLEVTVFDANTIKKCVLEVLTGLQFTTPFSTHDEVTTWCSAYVRRYGGANEFINIIDYGRSLELNHEFVKDTFLPHVLEKALALPTGTDVVVAYKGAFSDNVIDRMTREILRIANGLNLYEVEYRTLFRLITEVMIKPPHPWIVNHTTQSSVLKYNREKAKSHLDEISSKVAKNAPRLAVPSALECAAHSCAAILAKFGFMLGVEGKYGLDELIRLCDIKIKQKNLVLWEFCEPEKFEEGLLLLGVTVRSFTGTLQRLAMGLRDSNRTDEALIATYENVRALFHQMETLCEQ